jgi:hypothetical protein
MQEQPSRRQVVAWLAGVQRDLNQIDEHIAPYLERRRRLEARQALLKDLLSSFEPEEAGESADADEDGRDAPTWSLSSQPAIGVGDYVRDRAEEILRSEGPMHINDLHTRFVASGFSVPGAGKPVNLIVHLRKDPGVVSPARGMYALRDQVDVASLPSTRRRKKRPRRPKRKGA